MPANLTVIGDMEHLLAAGKTDWPAELLRCEAETAGHLDRAAEHAAAAGRCFRRANEALLAADRAVALSRARVLLTQADEMTIGPLFWYRLSLAAQKLREAGRSDLADRVEAMLREMNWNGLREVIEALEGERV